MGMFKSLTPEEQVQRDGGLEVKINDKESKCINDVTLESLEVNEARIRFNESKFTVKIGADIQK